MYHAIRRLSESVHIKLHKLHTSVTDIQVATEPVSACCPADQIHASLVPPITHALPRIDPVYLWLLSAAAWRKLG